MSERTKNLAMKYAHKMGNSVLYNAEYLEEFAELIVLGCTEILEKEAVSSHNQGSCAYNLLMEEAMCMRLHFGIS